MAQWRFVLTDANYSPVGEIINASSRSVLLPLNKLPTASFTVRMDNPQADALVTSQGYIKVYRDTALRMFGPVISAEEVSDGLSQSINVQAAGGMWVLTKRLAGKTAGGQAYGLTDRAAIAKQIIDAANAENETGIRTGTLLSTAGAASTYTAGPYKPVADCVGELGKIADGFDWEVVPMEPTALDRATGKIGDWHAEPLLGVERPNAVFEYGFNTRANVVSYHVQTTRETQANYVYHVPSDTGVAPVSASDAAAISTFGRMEDVAQADITDLTLRQRLVDEHVLVRRNPRRVVTFKPHVDDGTGRVPQFGVDYFVGDIIPARAVVGGAVRLDLNLRVYGVAVSIDDLGTEDVELTLVDEG